MRTKHLTVLATLWLACTISCYGQSNEDQNASLEKIEKEANALVQEQLEAYNARDIERFLAPYSDSVKIYNYPDDFRYQGKITMRTGYGSFFENTPKLHCEVVSRTVFGNKVIDQEKVTGLGKNGENVLEALAIYTIENGKISEVRFISK